MAILTAKWPLFNRVFNRTQATAAGIYVYAFADQPPRFSRPPAGVGGRPIFTCSSGSVTAVVSQAPSTCIQPERRNLTAHQEILNRLMAQETVLPVSFGMTVGSEKELERLLEVNQEALQKQLDRVHGAVELGVSVSLAVPSLIEYFVDRDEDLRRARERSLHPDASLDERLQVGRCCTTLLEQEQEACAERLMGALRSRCREMRRAEPSDEYELLNLFCLVERDRQTEWEIGVIDAAADLDVAHIFTITKPQAPHHFVQMNLMP